MSRSFYLTLRVLPAPVRPQIGLAYLLARATDTIADTELVSVERRLAALAELRAAILEEDSARAKTTPDFGELATAQAAPAGRGSSSERILLERIGNALALLRETSPSDRALTRAVLDTITSGQTLDLQRFGAASAERIVALRTDAELDDYTYRVAGCVGEFWTRMCRAHLFPNATLDDAVFLADGVRFGKGLQLVNILRDLPRDLRQGRCYLPAVALAQIGLQSVDLLLPASEPKLRPLYDRWLDIAEAHLAAGWNYTNTIPRRQIRVRLACAWPILIGAKTLKQLRRENVLDPNRRIKVSRAEVRGIIFQTVVRYAFATAWKSLFTRTK
ncbi:MAG: squalene/phytoene synthase family protein [Verrucomicrobia bacterium]|nr:squalene/phytoene synthase family protein [Verrucomicrobiota bacterium]